MKDTTDWFEAIVTNSQVWSVYPSGVARTQLGLNEDVMFWLRQNVGLKDTMRQMGVWTNTIPIMSPTTSFFFEDRDKAVLFKLTWG